MILSIVYVGKPASIGHKNALSEKERSDDPRQRIFVAAGLYIVEGVSEPIVAKGYGETGTHLSANICWEKLGRMTRCAEGRDRWEAA